MVSFYIINVHRVHQLHELSIHLIALAIESNTHFENDLILLLSISFSYFLQQTKANDSSLLFAILLKNSNDALIERPSLQWETVYKSVLQKRYLTVRMHFAKDRIDIDRIIFKYFQLVLVFLHPQTLSEWEITEHSVVYFGKKQKEKGGKKVSSEKKRKQRWIYDVVVLLFDCDWTISIDCALDNCDTFYCIRHFQQLFKRWFLFPSLYQFLHSVQQYLVTK